jgi:hypothetical protein
VAGWAIPTPEELDRFYCGYLCFQGLNPEPHEFTSKELYAKLYAITVGYIPNRVEDFKSVAAEAVTPFNREWEEFLSRQMMANPKFMQIKIDPITHLPVSRFNKRRWLQSKQFRRQARRQFNEIRDRKMNRPPSSDSATVVETDTGT